jgi:hypothetical protein
LRVEAVQLLEKLHIVALLVLAKGKQQVESLFSGQLPLALRVLLRI